MFKCSTADAPEQHSDGSQISGAPSTNEEAVDAERMAWALRTLKRMPPTLRRVFILRVIEERDEASVCAKLNISMERYRARLARAFEHIADAARKRRREV